MDSATLILKERCWRNSMTEYSGAVAVGILVGIVFTAFMIQFIRSIEAKKFKSSILESNDAKRKAIKEELEAILGHYKEIVEKTDTMVFKRKTNKIIDLISYLEKYRMN